MAPEPGNLFQPGRGYTEEDWNEVDSPELTDDELAAARPAREVLPPDLVAALENARPQKVVTIPLDRDIVERLEAEGPGWPQRVNAVLRKALGRR